MLACLLLVLVLLVLLGARPPWFCGEWDGGMGGWMERGKGGR